MIEVGDLVRGKKAENGMEYCSITSSKSICEVKEIDNGDWIVVTLVGSHDSVEYIGDEFEVQVSHMGKIYNKTE